MVADFYPCFRPVQQLADTKWAMTLKIAVMKEVRSRENRVSLIPSAVPELLKLQIEVLIEAGAGKESFFTDEDYENVGATIVSNAEFLLKEAQVILKVGTLENRGEIHESDMISPGSVVIGFLNPFGNRALIEHLTKRKVTAFSMEMIPRITRAQSMDALTSQASITGYKAALLAATKLGKFFPMMTTAAGTMAPAKVLVIGAGVVGLQAIATAKRLGATVEGFDIRPASKAEVESLGAKFVEIKLEEQAQGAGGYAKEVSAAAKQREQEVLAEHIRNSDVVITTALVPGKKAPILITKEMVEEMKRGSLIVDVAAEQGGNCSLTEPEKEILHNGVAIIGPVNLPSTMPIHASQMYSKNISSLLKHIIKDGNLAIDFDDEVTNRSCVTHDGIMRIF
jgi:NAD(P) transhydrogenase subunit alpha